MATVIKGVIKQYNSSATGVPYYASDSVANITAGESTTTKFLVMYLNTTDAKVYVADNTNAAIANDIIGISLNAVTVDNNVQVKRFGLVVWNSTLTAGDIYYLSTAGAITNVKPTTGFIYVVGRALADDIMMFDISVNSTNEMSKAIYDTNNNGIVDNAESAANLTGSQASAIVLNTAKVTESTTVSSPLVLTGYDITIPASSATVDGYLKSTDWVTFNAKQPAGNYATLDGVETFTNKTFTSPVINNPTGITKSDVGLSNVVNLDTSNASNITTGTLPSSVLPPVAISKPTVVASEADQLALVAEEGDVAVRSDLNKTYMKNAGTTGTMTDWTELQTPTDSVLSVNGYTGTIILTTTDINEGTNLYYTETRVTNNSAVLLNTAKVSDINHVAALLPNVDNTSDATKNAAVATLTNKRIKSRIYSTTSLATLTPEKATYDSFILTAQAVALTIANPATATPNNFDKIEIRIFDNGTAQTIAFGTAYVQGNHTPLPVTTTVGVTMNLGFEWNGSYYVLLAEN